MSALLRGIPSKHEAGFYYLNCFHSYGTEKQLQKYYNVCKNLDYCYIEMPEEDHKISKYNHGENSMKHLFVIYPDLL